MSGTDTVRRHGVRALVVLLGAATFLATVQVEPADAHVLRSERRMVAFINQAREVRGLPKLRINHAMTHRARTHSARMRKQGGIFHSNLRHTLRGISWRVAGENVGMGPNMRLLHRAFMASPPHRANVLYRPYRQIGVGVRWRNGVAFVTVVFVR